MRTIRRRGASPLRFRHHAPQPEFPNGGLLQLPVEEIIHLAALTHRVANAVGERREFASFRDGIFPIKQFAVFPVKPGADSVDLIQKVVVDFQIAHAVVDVLVCVPVDVHLGNGAVEFHLVQIVLHRVNQFVLQIFLQHRMTDEKHDRKGKQRHQQKRRRKPAGELPLQLCPFHSASSRST